MKLIPFIYLFCYLQPGYYDSEPQSFFQWFTDRIAAVETGTNHIIKGSVITNFMGMVGENQISPQTARFIQRKYDYSCDIAELSCNRKTRDSYLRWIRDRENPWWLVANMYNVGHNSEWINTNYVSQVMGNTNYLNGMKITAWKKGRHRAYLIKIRRRNGNKKM